MTKTPVRSTEGVRLALAAAASAAILGLLKVLGVLDLSLFRDAFVRKDPAIGLIAAALAAMSAVALIRYYILLRFVGLKPPVVRVAAAGLISQAVGQWAGSAAVTEVLRFGLMTGLGSGGENLEGEAAGAKTRIGLSILIDRLMGLGAMFLIGGCAAIRLHLGDGMLVKYPALVFILGVVLFVVGLGLMLAPLLTRTGPGLKLAKFLAIKASARPAVAEVPAPKSRPAARMWRALSSAADLLTGAAARPRRLLAPIALSLVVPFLNAATLYYAARAVGRPLPLAAILVSVPFTIAAIALPLGLAGYGGPQLVAVGVFGLFNVAPEAVVAACLVQNTVALAVTTLLGGLGAGLAFDALRAAFHSRRDRNPGRRSR
jgi:uncharacterized membrane protein YbhN (UPF0104 family)